ncbi:hypothetical protein VBG40_10645 [Vagococcus fluvialis]|uniref:hypothetical protein n=1 Tax=Vagococcus fluvialis TaxID=2738 RepID=UPI0037BB57ED
MRVLEINDGKSNFLVGDKLISPESLSRDNLLKILNKIYENRNDSIEIPQIEEIKKIKNPIEREIVEQIIQKISEFNDNVDNIRQEVESPFPPVNN